jgi:peptidylamidoglycolate lyase
MNRKYFLQQTGIALTGLVITKDLFAKPKSPVYGHNGMRFRLDKSWGTLNPSKHPVNDCHEMVQDSKGRIVLLTNETKNNLLVYSKSGRLVRSAAHEFPGAHGLTIHKANGEDFFFITDTVKRQVYKTTNQGSILMTLDYPADTGVYKNREAFKPTETAVLDNGEFYVADGYGSQYIMHYDANGKLKHFFGGRGEEQKNLDNAHGICVDRRGAVPTLLVTDRTRNCFKRFSLDGRWIETIALPGACVCRPVIKGDYLYAAVLRSPNISTAASGFVTILDKNNRVVSNIGGAEPRYINNQLQPMSQAEKIFIHPHDVCVDDDENIYVAQWNAGKVYPFKMRRVS